MTIVQAISRIVLYCRRYSHRRAYLRLAAFTALAAVCLSPPLAAATVVRMEISLGGTPAGNIDIELLDDQVPTTVRNFLNYAGRHAYQGGYSNSIIHRNAHNFSLPGAPIFAIQGGGHTYFPNPFYPAFSSIPIFFQHITPGMPIRNEFSPSRPNLRGTISMAKLGGQPDSATSEWFINVTDNSFLDDPNDSSGGYTVFGHVLAGMNVVDTIASLQPVYLGPLDPNDPSDDGDFSYDAFGELPVLDNYDRVTRPKPQPLQENLVFVSLIPNIRSAFTPTGILATFTADVDMILNSVGTVDTDTAVLRLGSFTSPPNQSFYFNNGMFTLSMTGVMGPTGRIVTMYDGAYVRPTHYYAYGPTPDNPAPHWYDFAFDGETGAEIKNNRIILHFVDGKRGDEDLTANSITHTGAQAVVTENASSSSQSGGGCSIVTTPSQTSRGGDWIVVSLFLALLALVRRRTHHNRIQRAPRWRNSDLEPSPLMEEG